MITRRRTKFIWISDTIQHEAYTAKKKQTTQSLSKRNTGAFKKTSSTKLTEPSPSSENVASHPSSIIITPWKSSPEKKNRS